MFLCLALLPGSPWPKARAQEAFAGFEAPGEYQADFNAWNDTGGTDGGNPAFAQDATSGVGGTGGVSVFQSTDTTATYKKTSWDFSAPGAALVISALVHANGQVSGDKVQLGITSVAANGLNNNAGVAFETFRIVPQSSSSWSLREQFRSAGALNESVLGNVTIAPGRWYKFAVSLTNTAGASGSYQAACAICDYGANGLSPGTNAVSFSTLLSHTGQADVTAPTMWPALRAFQDGGIDAWDNFLVYTPNSPPVVTSPLRNRSIAAGASATFQVLADGPGPLSYAWFANGRFVPNVSGPSYTTTPLATSDTNVTVVVSNGTGSSTNSATLQVFTPSAPTVEALPPTGIQSTVATLQGRIDNTGGEIPTVTIYYGPADGGTNAGAWAHAVVLGAQAAAFSQLLTGLSSSTTYYFTAEAVNSAGAPAWAVPSQSFTTLAADPVSSSVSVLTHHNDNYRSGANLNETVLNVNNVGPGTFGLILTRPVDDQIYAQPLVAADVEIPGRGRHDLVVVATVNDTVYAFDASDSSVAEPYWTASFINPPSIVAPRNTDMTGACGGQYRDFSGNCGIVGTPVIDSSTSTLYVVGRTKESGTTFVQRLHALDLGTGAERPNSPVIITATYPGSGDGNVGGLITFDPQKQNQRAGLALVNGTVYITWSSHCDWGPYHGWVIGYDAATLEQKVVYNDTPEGYNGGIWMSGQAPAADSDGNLYLSTGNGSVGMPGSPQTVVNRGESFLKLTPNGSTLTVTSWFTPYNWQNLENGDVDLGSGGVLLIPGTNLIFSGGKQGMVYLANRDEMGGLSQSPLSDTNVIQSFPVSPNQVHGGPVWWDGPGGPYAYIWPSAVQLQQYQFDRAAGKFTLPAYKMGPTAAPAGQPGGILGLSANGTNSGTGILWASHQLSGDANQQVRPGMLRAFNAENVSDELYNSEEVTGRDSVGNFAKFCPPTIANGKVYLATFSNRLNVYGLLPRPALSIGRSGGNVTISWPVPAGTRYTLQASPNLRTGTWTSVTNNVVVSGGAAQVTLPASGPSSFHRLQQ